MRPNTWANSNAANLTEFLLSFFPRISGFRELGREGRGGREADRWERKERVRRRRLDILDGQWATNFRVGGEGRLDCHLCS